MHPWRERLQRWLSPLARRTPLSPNAVSIVALLLNVIAAWLLYERRFLLALGFIAIGGMADAFDGVVARVQGKTSRYGDFLDHTLDRLSDLLLVSGWALGNGVRPELAIATVICIILNGYMGTQIEATWGKRHYEQIGRGEFVLALILFPIISSILLDNGWWSVAPGGLRIAEWMSLLLVAFSVQGIAQRFALASRLERGQ